MKNFSTLLRWKIAVMLLLSVALLATVFVTSPHAFASTKNSQKAVVASDVIVPDGDHGCPLYYVCIYPQNAGWNHDHPAQKYYYYGVYQLSNQFGNHYIYNHQVGGGLWLCDGWNGDNCPAYLSPGTAAVDYNLTPINSIMLNPAYGD